MASLLPPLLLQVSAATTSVMVLLSSLTATVQYAILGQINVDYALLFGLVALGSSVAGEGRGRGGVGGAGHGGRAAGEGRGGGGMGGPGGSRGRGTGAGELDAGAGCRGWMQGRGRGRGTGAGPWTQVVRSRQ